MNILGVKLNIHKKFFSKIGFNYLIMGIVAIICQIIIVNLINITHPEYLANINILSGLSSFCNYVLPFPIFYWLMKKLESYNLEKTGINIQQGTITLDADNTIITGDLKIKGFIYMTYK